MTTINSTHSNIQPQLNCEIPKISSNDFQERINHLAFKFFQEYSKIGPEKNFCFFLPCILSNMSMLFAGAPPELKRAFHEEFRLEGITEEQWHQGVAGWTSTILQHVKSIQDQKAVPFDFTLTSNQAIALHKDRQLNSNAEETFHNLYQAEVISFNSANEAEEKSNEWIEAKTDGEIKNLVENLDPGTTAILLSAATFKGSWTYPFNQELTEKEIFQNYLGELCMVDRMKMDTDDLRFGWIKKIEIMELPFHGDVSMMIFLPYCAATDCVDSLTKNMTFENFSPFFSNVDKNLRNQWSMSIALPRLEISEKDDLLNCLSGWSLINKIGNSDLAGSLIQTSKPTIVDKMVVQTNLKVDEEGAAIKAAMYTPCYEDSCPPEPYYVNRPFAYAFFEKHTNTILAMGRVTNLPGEALTEDQKRRYGRYYL